MPNPTTPAESCGCADPALDELRRLVGLGVDQRMASHLLWGDESRIGNELAVEEAGRRARLFVRQSLQAAFPWLRLPPTDRPANPTTDRSAA